jgi:hypothetical protein
MLPRCRGLGLTVRTEAQVGSLAVYYQVILAGCGKMRFPNPCGYYRVFGARDGSGFPTAIQRDSVAELGIFPQPAGPTIPLFFGIMGLRLDYHQNL